MHDPNPQALPPRCPHCGSVLVDDGDWYCMGLYGHAPAPTKRERKGYAPARGRDAPGAHTIRLSQGYAVFGSTVAEPPPSSAEAHGESTVGVPRDLAVIDVAHLAMCDFAREWLGCESRQSLLDSGWLTPDTRRALQHGSEPQARLRDVLRSRLGTVGQWMAHVWDRVTRG